MFSIAIPGLVNTLLFLEPDLYIKWSHHQITDDSSVLMEYLRGSELELRRLVASLVSTVHTGGRYRNVATHYAATTTFFTL